MSEPAPVSVIIVNFNGGDLLVDCVRSALASTCPVEIYVVDNASTDNSILQLRRRLRADAPVTIIENKHNYGFAKANNRALSEAKGDYLLFLNPDCLIQPDTVERMKKVMDEHPRAGIGGGLILNPDGTEQKGCRRRVPTPWRTFVRVMGLSKLLPDHAWFSDFDLHAQPLPDRPEVVDAISGSFMFVKRAALDAVGPMDEGYFLHCEDLDWCMRFREAGYDVLFVPDIKVVHFKGVCGRTRPVRVMWYMHKGMVRFYRKFFRRRYSIVLMWLVFAAVWSRFVLMAGLATVRRVVLPGREEVDTGSTGTATLPGAVAASLSKTSTPGTAGGVIVTGAGGQIGHYLLPKLSQAGFQVFALSRQKMSVDEHENPLWLRCDLESRSALPATDHAKVLMHLAPLWLLPARLDEFAAAGISRIVAFSSTSRFTKVDSATEQERLVANTLADAEARCERLCAERNIALTIFRPTLIYGCGMDKNVTTIARFVSRFGFFVIAGEGSGKRQPVHAEDLADACMAALDNPQSEGRAYNLSGGQTLSYRAMVEAIFQALGQRSRVLEIPRWLLRTALKAVACLPGYHHVTPSMADRMTQDLYFDHSDASRDLGYHPRRFLEPPYRRPRKLVPTVVGAPVSMESSVLVTGANGFIGSALCSQLLRRGCKVTGTVRNPEAASVLEPGVQIRVIDDIAEEDGWPELLQGVECLIHLAAFVHETPSGPLSEAKVRYQRLNADATVRLARAAVKAGVKRFIYISTVKVHGERSEPGERFNESMTPNPVGPYAESKLYAEYALRKIEHDHGLEVVVVRPPLVYGPGVKANFLRLLRLVAGGMPLPLANVDNSRSFIYLENLIDVLIRCVDHPGAAGETFLVSDGEDVSTADLIRLLAFYFGHRADLFPMPVSVLRLAGEVSGGAGSINRLIESLVIDSAKVRTALDWAPPYTLMDGLERTVLWYRERMLPLKVYSPPQSQYPAISYPEGVPGG